MSPSHALVDPVFRAYLAIVAAVLATAGLLLVSLEWLFRMQVGNVWKTYLSWLWMTPLVAAFIFAGRVPFILATTSVALLAAREFSLASGLSRDRAMSAPLFLGIAGAGVMTIARVSFIAVLAPALALIILLPILQNSPRGAIRRMSLGMLGLLYLGWMFGELGRFANSPNAYGYLCFLFFATELNDVAAFCCGRMFGRHPLRSAISPAKSWEGALGALALSLGLPWLLRFSFPFFGARELLGAGLIVGIGAPLGDLALSVVKRDLGVKDWSGAIPGHGGILDRIDSLIFVAPLFMLLTEYYYPGR
jgi:phosphatidate cytidylyltransferase